MRRYAQIKVDIWNDDDFRGLSPLAQWLFFALLSHPTLSNAGVGDWRANRIAAFSTGADVDLVYAAAEELQANRYVLFDEDTEEYLIRSFPRNDGLMKMPNMAAGLVKAAAEVASGFLREVLRWELNRLHVEEPSLRAWGVGQVQKFLKEGDFDPDIDPSRTLREPFENPSVKGNVIHQRFTHQNLRISPSETLKNHIDPSGKGSGGGSPTPYTIHHRESLKEGVQNVTVTRERDPSPENFSGDPWGAPAGAAPDSWCTEDDPRCREHAHLPRVEVPACHACAEVRAWFRDRHRSGEQARRAAIDACQWCDQNGLFSGKWPDGSGFSARCEHGERPPVVPPPPPEFEPRTDPEWRRELVDGFRNRSKTQNLGA